MEHNVLLPLLNLRDSPFGIQCRCINGVIFVALLCCNGAFLASYAAKYTGVVPQCVIAFVMILFVIKSFQVGWRFTCQKCCKKMAKRYQIWLDNQLDNKRDVSSDNHDNTAHKTEAMADNLLVNVLSKLGDTRKSTANGTTKRAIRDCVRNSVKVANTKKPLIPFGVKDPSKMQRVLGHVEVDDNTHCDHGILEEFPSPDRGPKGQNLVLIPADDESNRSLVSKRRRSTTLTDFFNIVSKAPSDLKRQSLGYKTSQSSKKSSKCRQLSDTVFLMDESGPLFDDIPLGNIFAGRKSFKASNKSTSAKNKSSFAKLIHEDVFEKANQLLAEAEQKKVIESNPVDGLREPVEFLYEEESQKTPACCSGGFCSHKPKFSKELPLTGCDGSCTKKAAGTDIPYAPISHEPEADTVPIVPDVEQESKAAKPEYIEAVNNDVVNNEVVTRYPNVLAAQNEGGASDLAFSNYNGECSHLKTLHHQFEKPRSIPDKNDLTQQKSPNFDNAVGTLDNEADMALDVNLQSKDEASAENDMMDKIDPITPIEETVPIQVRQGADVPVALFLPTVKTDEEIGESKESLKSVSAATQTDDRQDKVGLSLSPIRRNTHFWSNAATCDSKESRRSVQKGTKSLTGMELMVITNKSQSETDDFLKTERTSSTKGSKRFKMPFESNILQCETGSKELKTARKGRKRKTKKSPSVKSVVTQTNETQEPRRDKNYFGGLPFVPQKLFATNHLSSDIPQVVEGGDAGSLDFVNYNERANVYSHAPSDATVSSIETFTTSDSESRMSPTTRKIYFGCFVTLVGAISSCIVCKNDIGWVNVLASHLENPFLFLSMFLTSILPHFRRRTLKRKMVFSLIVCNAVLFTLCLVDESSNVFRKVKTALSFLHVIKSQLWQVNNQYASAMMYLVPPSVAHFCSEPVLENFFRASMFLILPIIMRLSANRLRYSRKSTSPSDQFLACDSSPNATELLSPDKFEAIDVDPKNLLGDSAVELQPDFEIDNSHIIKAPILMTMPLDVGGDSVSKCRTSLKKQSSVSDGKRKGKSRREKFKIGLQYEMNLDSSKDE